MIYGSNEHPSVAEALEVKVKIFHHLGEKTEAKSLIERALKIRENSYGKDHPEVSRSVHDLGSYYLRLGRYKEAINNFEQARQITSKVFGKGHPDYVERTLHLANARNEQGEYQQALKLIEDVEDVLPEGNHYLTARWLQLMSELQRRLGQFEKAMQYIDKAIAMKKAIYGNDPHPSVADAFEVQAKIYDHRCEFDKEQAVWEKVLDIQRQFYAEEHPALATTHHNYANLYRRKGEYAKAIELLDTSLDITEKSLGNTHASYFGRLILRASCLYEQQEYLLAQEILDDAKKMQADIFGDAPHPYLARMLQLQSEILRRQGRFNQALEAIEQAIAMKEVIYGSNEHPSVAEALEVKADLLLNQNQVKESSEILDKIDHIRSNVYSKIHPEYANYQLRRAKWYSIAGRYDEASDMLGQSLQTCLEAFASGHPETIRRKIELARLARIRNDIVEAENWINSVCETLGDRLGSEDSLIVAETYQELSNIKRSQGDYHTALAELEKAQEIERKIFDLESPAVIELQNERAKSLIIFRRLNEANDVVESALRNVGSDEPAYRLLKSDLLAQRGIIENYQKEFGRAINSLEEAIEIRKDLSGSDNVDLARLYIEKAMVLRHQSMFKEAFENLEVAQNIDNFLGFDENHVYFARILLEQGQTYLEKRNDYAAQEHLKEALRIYDIQPNRYVKQHADAIQALGRIYFENGFLDEASESYKKALDIRNNIYRNFHPEIAETLYSQAQVLLKVKGNGKSNELRKDARQKLEKAIDMLQQCEGDNTKLMSNIESTLKDM